MLILDHGSGVLSHIQCGFNYFPAHWYDESAKARRTISIIGRAGQMNLIGYDWAPKGVELITRQRSKPLRLAAASDGYVWQAGARQMAEFLSGAPDPLFSPQHALHVLEIMSAAKESQATGRRIKMKSSFAQEHRQ